MNIHARSVPPHPGLPAGPHGRVLFPPAKVNLYLWVGGKQHDGYHQVETLLATVNLYDTLEIQPRGDGELKLTCEPDTIPTGPGNLVWKAAEALRREFGVTAGATMRLTKRIPHEAGLGGGSSDAAAAIAGLNAVWGLNRSLEGLLSVAAEVGSDVPGVLACLPHERAGSATLVCRTALCSGRGEHVQRFVGGPAIHLVIVKPPVGCPTGEVYKRFRGYAGGVKLKSIANAVCAGDAEALVAEMFNALQPAAFDLQPLVRKVYDRLTNCRPLGVLLSGSGASVFAVGRDAADAAAVADRFARLTGPDPELAACRVFVVRTLGAMT